MKNKKISKLECAIGLLFGIEGIISGIDKYFNITGTVSYGFYPVGMIISGSVLFIVFFVVLLIKINKGKEI